MRVDECRLPLTEGEFRAVGYRALADASEHVALVVGSLDNPEAPLVRVTWVWTSPNV